jgi:hypothetical protein
MNKKNLKKIGYIAMSIMVLNIILFAFTVINATVFWIVIILGAIFTYFILPKLKEPKLKK